MKTLIFCITFVSALTCFAATPHSSDHGSHEDGTPDKEQALKVLAQTDAKAEDINTALDTLKHFGDFSEPAAWTLLHFLDRDSTPAIRAKAANVFYLLFYDKRGFENAILTFLIRADVQVRIEKLMLYDTNIEVQKYTAQIGQILITSFEKADAEALASIYVPMLIRGLKHPNQALRLEIFPALDNLNDTDYFKNTPQVRTDLKLILEAAKQDPEKDFPDFVEMLESILKKLEPIPG